VRPLLALLALLCATPALADDDEALDLDLDQDSFSLADGDCDDTRAWVHPGAPEVCDGRDSDCDGEISTSLDTGEQDADGDGWRVCAGDCNDDRGDVHPHAPELCDDFDNDCDDDRPLSEQDLDADGLAPCEGDCNDLEARVRPGLSDAPGTEGVDDDCDGVIDEGLLPSGDDDDTTDLPAGCTERGCGWSFRAAAPGDRGSPLVAFAALGLLIGRRDRRRLCEIDSSSGSGSPPSCSASSSSKSTCPPSAGRSSTRTPGSSPP